MLATQGFDTQQDEDRGEEETEGLTEAEMLAEIFERFDMDADGFLNRRSFSLPPSLSLSPLSLSLSLSGVRACAACLFLTLSLAFQ